MPKIVDHESTRAELVERCTALFAQDGYAAVTLRKVAEALEVSTGKLYHYFDNKESLFLAVLDAVMSKDEQQADLLLLLPRALRLPAMLHFIDANRERYWANVHVLIDALRIADAQMRKRIHSAAAHYTKRIAEILEVDPQGARFLLSMVNGVLVHDHLENKATSFISLQNALDAALGELR